MEDYIFILIAILLSVFGAINRKKKQRQIVENEDSATVRKPSVFDQLFEDPFFRDEQTQVKPTETEPTTQKEIYQPLRKKTVSPPASSTTSRKSAIPFAITDHLPKRRIHPLMKDFSLKKAVIYSEILQRKY